MIPSIVQNAVNRTNLNDSGVSRENYGTARPVLFVRPTAVRFRRPDSWSSIAPECPLRYSARLEGHSIDSEAIIPQTLANFWGALSK